MDAGKGVGASDAVIEYEPPRHGGSCASSKLESEKAGKQPDYRKAFQQLHLQQKKLQERDQLRARIRELEAQLVPPVAKDRDRKHEIAWEIVREDQ